MAKENRNRDKAVLLHLTEDEMRIAKEKAKMASFSVSHFLRKMIEDGFIKSNDDLQSIIIICGEITPIDINLSQISRQAYANESVTYELNMLREEFDEIRRIIFDYLFSRP